MSGDKPTINVFDVVVINGFTWTCEFKRNLSLVGPTVYVTG